MRLLLIEDDREAAAYLVKAFRESGHSLDHAADGVSGYDLAHEGGYDVLVVDRMLPKMDGLSLIAALRAQNNSTPALILSALGQVDDRVKGLRSGGDDYLSKPYAFSELLARIESLGRRRQGPMASGPETVLRYDDLLMDLLARRVERGGREIDLQPRELKVFEEQFGEQLPAHGGRTLLTLQDMVGIRAAQERDRKSVYLLYNPDDSDIYAGNLKEVPEYRQTGIRDYVYFQIPIDPDPASHR